MMYRTNSRLLFLQCLQPCICSHPVCQSETIWTPSFSGGWIITAWCIHGGLLSVYPFIERAGFTISETCLIDSQMPITNFFSVLLSTSSPTLILGRLQPWVALNKMSSRLLVCLDVNCLWHRGSSRRVHSPMIKEQTSVIFQRLRMLFLNPKSRIRTRVILPPLNSSYNSRIIFFLPGAEI